MREAIRVERLSKSYGNLLALDGLSLSVRQNTVFGLLGANGAGKSTTIECILGTRRADSGRVSVLGRDPQSGRRGLFQEVGVQFQEGDYQPEIKVSELCEETRLASTKVPRTGRRYAGNLASGTRRTGRSKAYPAGSASGFSSSWRSSRPPGSSFLTS